MYRRKYTAQNSNTTRISIGLWYMKDATYQNNKHTQKIAILPINVQQTVQHIEVQSIVVGI